MEKIVTLLLMFTFILFSNYSLSEAQNKNNTSRAFFVFGDSLVDSGNNNFLITEARADSPPYGIDYPTHRPTGRFSNGLNIPDIISKFNFSISYIIVKQLIHAKS